MIRTAPVEREEFSADVWLIEVPGSLADVDMGLLDNYERARTFEFIREETAARYAALRVAAKKIVASYLSIQISEVSIGRRGCPRCGSVEHGPPTIVAPLVLHWAPALSLARSGGYGVVALASGVDLGVDIEVVDPQFDYWDVAKICCSVDEIEFLRSRQSRGPSSFYRCWVRKEAVTKAIGVGVVDSLVHLDMRLEKDSPVMVGSSQTSKVWHVDDLVLPWPLIGALARPANASSLVAVHHGLTKD